MRLAVSALLPAAVAAAKASLGSLYIYDDQVSSDQASVKVNADTARLIIASQLGLEQYHSLKGQDDASLDTINRLSAHDSLFAARDAASVALILSTVGQDGIATSHTLSFCFTSLIFDRPAFLFRLFQRPECPDPECPFLPSFGKAPR